MILVSLIGHDLSTITPILFELKYKIKKHILVCDDYPSKIKKANFIQNGIKYLKKEYKIKFQTQQITVDLKNSANLKSILQQIKQNKQNCEDVYINMGDGPIHVGIMLAFDIIPEGGKIISYNKLKNSYNLIDKKGFLVQKIKYSMGIKDYCNLRSINLTRYKKIEDIKKRARDIYWLFENFQRFNKARVALLKNARGFPYGEHKDILDVLKKLKIINKKRKLLRAQYLSGGIFEEYIFLLVNSLDFDEVYANVEVEYGDNPGEGIENEFDILMIKDNILHIIECKLSRRVDGARMVYKYDALRQIPGFGSKVMIVNISDRSKRLYLGYNTSKSFTKSIIKRAKLLDIFIYHEDSIKEEKFKRSVEDFFLKNEG